MGFKTWEQVKNLIICYYASGVLFIRSFFLVERPLFLFFIISIYPLFTLFITVDASWAPFIHMRLLIAIGLYLIGIDSMGSYLAKNINQFPYLIDFFSGRNTFTLEGKYLYAGWSALIIGKTPMTATGRAAIAAAFVSGGFFLYNNHLQRVYDSEEAERQRTHESAEAVRQRAFANYTYARDQYDKSYFKRGPKPTWSEKDFNNWSENKK